ncbi:hypothetical protein [Streptomyces sp. BK205]|uniref:hypothetical protein n=1 Tax=Streptomyces sp. BK205 TaxID=2512164 RepID=UPI0010540F62|nr:hypothetical protein [Streptomyces sp. BK205]TCR27016.1 hypothetical protein EV578_101968 [Streptomyces sp. BK205]
MNERKSVLSSGRDEYVSPFTWGSLTGVVATVAWLAVGPLGPLWLYGLGWALALLGVNGVSWLLVRHRGRGLPQPAPFVAGLLRLGPESWLLAPHWAKARSVAGGFLVLATIAAGIGWSAGEEYQTLANLRHQGLRTDATVVEITGRSEEGWATAVTVRFATPSGLCRRTSMWRSAQQPMRSQERASPSSTTRHGPRKSATLRTSTDMTPMEYDKVRS